MGFVVVPVSLRAANRYVEAIHRHSGRLPGAKFAIAAIDSDSGAVHGVAVAGMPKARLLDDGYTLEVNRVCTDGAFNCCSFLYGACKRAAQAMGFWRMVTYTKPSEAGASLKASGWRLIESNAGDDWAHHTKRPGGQPWGGPVNRWEVVMAGRPPAVVWPDLLGEPDSPPLF